MLAVTIKILKTSIRNVLPLFIKHYLWSCWRLTEAKTQRRSIGKDPQPVGVWVSTEVYVTEWLLAKGEDSHWVSPVKFFLVPLVHSCSCLNFISARAKEDSWPPRTARATHLHSHLRRLAKLQVALTSPASVSMVVEAPGSGPYLRTPAHKNQLPFPQGESAASM